ncbi:MAG: HdeD family acid-resistance protein, partial [Sciscionella sp.]
MASELTADAHRATTWSIGLSVLMIAAGVLAIFVPMIAGIAVTALVGWLLIFCGALHLAFAWRGGHARAVLWEILLGVAYGAIGLYLIARPIMGLASLAFAIAFYLFIEGILEFILSFQLRPARGTGWLLVDAIITLVLAVMIWATWPSSAVWV